MKTLLDGKKHEKKGYIERHQGQEEEKRVTRVHVPEVPRAQKSIKFIKLWTDNIYSKYKT